MSEYIEREALMEELAAIQSATYMSTCLTEDECKGKRWMIARAIDAVKDAPAADVAEVVRCKDCKHNGTWQCHMEYDEYHPEADIHHEMHGDDDFCSYGERKDGAE